MTVLPFPNLGEGLSQGWQSNELTKLSNACATAIPNGGASGWEVGMTERGDPQLYLLGPAPEHDCILSISRLGRLYVVEDGRGQVLFEDDNLVRLADETCRALRRRKTEMVARITVCWCAVREFLEEKVEPVLAEPVEFVTHFAPHLAALA
jgi:hypothetical protein